MRTMLLVDDDPVVRKLGMFAFGKLANFDVRQAPGGERALVMLDEFTPDVVLLDVMMEGMDGPETFGRIKRKFPTLPIIFLTGQELPEQVQALRALGATDALAKPFDPKTIGRAVHAILDKI